MPEKQRTTRTEWISKDEKFERITAFQTTVAGVVPRRAAASTSRRRVREDAHNTRAAPDPLLHDADLDRTLVAVTADKLTFNLS